MNFLVIGAGNMGLAYTKAMLHHRVFSRHQISIVDKALEKMVMAKDVGIDKVSDNIDDKILSDAGIILLAVKPQDTPSLFGQLKGKLRNDQIVISIMAGVQIQVLKEQCGIHKVVRAMPNLPLLVGKGMTVYVAEHFDELEKEWIKKILHPTGEAIQVDNEEMIDVATAVSGSGPAYVFYFLQSMISASKQMGFSESDSIILAIQTFKGAVQLLEDYNFSCTEWIQKVSSKGGTTERAIQHFRKKELETIIEEGMNEALRRSRELSNPQ